MIASHRGTFCIVGLTPFLLLLLAAAIAGCKDSSAEVAPAEGPSAEESPGLAVRAEPAQRRTIVQWVDGLGNCEALPQKIATLTPAIEGRVLRILAEQGREVRAEEPIVELDPTLSQANLDEKKAARDALEAAVEKAAATIERLRPLRERGEIPQPQMFEAELALRQAQLQRQTADATVASAKAQLYLHTIRSPIDGVIESLSCRLGQTLAAGAALGEVVDSRQLHVVVWLPAADARLVHVGQPARITFSEVRSGEAPSTQPEGEALSGQVKFVGRVVDPQTGNLPVRVLVDNSAGRLAVGQTAAAAIDVGRQADLLVVPAQAIEDLGEGPLLSVIRGGKSVLLQHPRLGLKDHGWVEVAGTDLKEGELVIVEGGYSLPEGTKVAVQPAAENDQRPAPENGKHSAGEPHPGAVP